MRLFGAYPYGHPPIGTVESVAKIDRPDLMFARERFLNANDATIVVIGGVDKLRVMRALRQLLGPWQRGDSHGSGNLPPAQPGATRGFW